MKFGQRESGKIVRCLPDENKVSPGSHSLTTAQIAFKICHGQPPTIYSECSRFHPSRFSFGGVIPERVNTVKIIIIIIIILYYVKIQKLKGKKHIQSIVVKQAYIKSQYIACKLIPHMPLNSCAWNVDQWLYNAIFSSYTVYLSLTEPTENQQQSITADSHLFPKQHATLVDKIWHWQTITVKL